MGARLDAFSNGAGQMAAGVGQKMSSAAASGKDLAGSMGDVASFSGSMGKKALDVGINMAGNAAQAKIAQFQQGLGQVDLSNAVQSIQGGAQSVGSELMAPGSSGDPRAYEMRNRLGEMGRTLASAGDTFAETAANAGNTTTPKGLSEGPYGPYKGYLGRDKEGRAEPVDRGDYAAMHAPHAARKKQEARDAWKKKMDDAQQAAHDRKYGKGTKAERAKAQKERDAKRAEERANAASKGPSGLEKLVGDPVDPADPNAPATPAEGYITPNPQGVEALFDPNAGLTPEQVAYRDAMGDPEAAKDAPADPVPPTGTNDYNPIQAPGAPFNQDAADFPFGPTEGDPGTTSRPSGPKPTPSSPSSPGDAATPAEPTADAEPVAATSKEPVKPKPKPKPKAADKPATKKTPKSRKRGLPEGTVKRTAGEGQNPSSSPANNALFGIPPQDDNDEK